MPFLPGKIRVQESHPLLALFYPDLLKVSETRASLIETLLKLSQRLLRKLEVEPRNFASRFELVGVAGLLPDVEPHIISLPANGKFRDLKFALCQRYRRGRLGRE